MGIWRFFEVWRSAEGVWASQAHPLFLKIDGEPDAPRKALAGGNRPETLPFPLRLRQTKRSGGHGNRLKTEVALHAVHGEMAENGIGLEPQ